MPRSWQNTRTRCPLASCSVISLLQSFRLVSRTFQMCPLPNYLKRAVHEALTTHVCRRAIGRDKVERVFDGRYLVRPHSGVPEALDDVGIHTPGHRTDKAVRGWRHIGRAEL